MSEEMNMKKVIAFFDEFIKDAISVNAIEEAKEAKEIKDYLESLDKGCEGCIYESPLHDDGFGNMGSVCMYTGSCSRKHPDNYTPKEAQE